MAPDHTLPSLFTLGDIESKAVLKASAKAHQALGVLKGVAATIPNQYILINTLSLQEAKESSEIENIITTQDDLYQSNYKANIFTSIPAKEVHRYAQALQLGFEILKQQELITNNALKQIQGTLEDNDAGFRTQMGTQLKNQHTGEVIYTPPQQAQTILTLMGDLERFINENEAVDYDDLVKMAIIHHQFESIHPFYDGNGRTGRILNILYLVKQGLLDTPILYLSRYINQHKNQYYQLLQSVREDKNWEPWLLYMMEAIAVSAKQATSLINQIRELMQQHKEVMREKLPKIYSHDLLNNLFTHPYTKIEFVMQDLGVHRNTATRYLEELVEIGLVHKYKKSTENYYLNTALFQLLTNIKPI